MTIHLRGHHLLCLLTYKGEGYSPAFIAGFDAVVHRIAGGEDVEIIEGPDEICAALLAEDACAHCTLPRVLTRDRLALADIAREIPELVLKVKINVTPSLQAKLRRAFAQNRIRSACGGCEWHAFCTDIAKKNFEDTLI